MTIFYRDTLGMLSVKLETATGIAFVDGLVYATATDGERLKIKVDDLVLIVRED